MEAPKFVHHFEHFKIELEIISSEKEKNILRVEVENLRNLNIWIHDVLEENIKGKVPLLIVNSRNNQSSGKQYRELLWDFKRRNKRRSTRKRNILPTNSSWHNVTCML